jgi:predicted transcriptional regulator
LRPRQIDVLLLLATARGPMSRTTVAERLGIHRVRVEVLGSLLDCGLVQEKRMTIDDGLTERVLSITPAGRALAREIHTRQRLAALSNRNGTNH